jgi:hypothetical protein
MTSNDRLIVDNDLKRMWKEAVVVLPEVLLQHLHGESEENYEKSQSE